MVFRLLSLFLSLYSQRFDRFVLELLQVFLVELGSIHRTLDQTLYLIQEGRFF